ncbi:MAG: methyltransferase domain-containing protein, partial [Burkholderiales bacterium]|nr:methyltransferase domain-containing protein [Burkholderiales bacterium]
VAVFGAAALERAAVGAGERVIDVGCGGGETTRELARRVGAAGRVLGLDVSRPLLDLARARAAGSAAAPIEFSEADAAQAELPAAVDLVFSRFGIMFFDQPAPALGHLRRALRPGGRLVFVCWRAPRDNPWAMAPLVAARKHVDLRPPKADPNAPGPFAFADPDRLRALLEEAGYASISIERCDAPVRIGADTRAAAENAARIGPAAQFIRECRPEDRPALMAAIEQALAPLAAADGSISLAGSSWIVSAING